MKAYKMSIPTGVERPIPGTDLKASGCFALVLAESVEEAKRRFIEVSQRDGDFYRWIEVADVVELDLVSGAVLLRGMI